jgi:NADH pyrophosphatase NudC (nudix superfamily)
VEEELFWFVRGHLRTVALMVGAVAMAWVVFRRYYLFCPHCRRPARRTREWRQCPHCGRQYHDRLERMDR